MNECPISLYFHVGGTFFNALYTAIFSVLTHSSIKIS